MQVGTTRAALDRILLHPSSLAASLDVHVVNPQEIGTTSSACVDAPGTVFKSESRGRPAI